MGRVSVGEDNDEGGEDSPTTTLAVQADDEERSGQEGRGEDCSAVERGERGRGGEEW